jgi:outer membrane protein TolC
MKRILLILFVFMSVLNAKAQEFPSLSYYEYLEYVKKNHPLVYQANNRAASGIANATMARGDFDPKLSFENNQKTFDGKEYFNQSNGSVSIPTWYGISLKGSYSQNEGVFLNPEEVLPANGLYSAGIEIDASEGLWINKRMATLKQAKFIINQTNSERLLLLNELVFEASKAYFNWLLAYGNLQVNERYLKNSEQRFEGVRMRALQGDIATIDTVESYTNVQQRMLELSQSKLDLIKARLEASNFLWEKDNIPLEISKLAVPLPINKNEIDQLLGIAEGVLDKFFLTRHPKLNVLQAQISVLEIDRSLKQAALFPDLTVNFNLLQTNTNNFIPLNTDQYKAGVRVSLPLFLRKERGALRLSNLKISDAKWDLSYENIIIQNKVEQNLQAQDFLLDQFVITGKMIQNYDRLLKGEQQKFSEGESSLFIVISREQKLIEALIMKNNIENKYLNTKISLFNSMALSIN